MGRILEGREKPGGLEGREEFFVTDIDGLQYVVTAQNIAGLATSFEDILEIPTAETNTALVLAPDGANGVEWVTPSGGSTPGIDDVLAEAQSLTANRILTLGAFDLTVQGNSSNTVDFNSLSTFNMTAPTEISLISGAVPFTLASIIARPNEIELTGGGFTFTMAATGGFTIVGLKSGASEGVSGAAINELWIDTGDDSIKIRTS